VFYVNSVAIKLFVFFLSENECKKRLQNCSTAIQYLMQAGVSLSVGDGIHITTEDIVNGDKELELFILWKIFVHLQVSMYFILLRINCCLVYFVISIHDE
jgi:hypothetical protein